MQKIDPVTGEATPQKRTLEDQLISLGARFGFAPYSQTALESEALAYVRRYYPQAQITDLPRGLGGILHAKRQEECDRTCPGRKSCPYSGIITEVIAYDSREGLIIRTGARVCGESIQHKEQLRIEETIKASRIPSRLKECTFSSYVVKGVDLPLQAAKSVMEEVSRTGGSVILGGPNGCGKTHLAIACLSEAIAAGRTGVFVLVPELLQEIRSGFNNPGNAVRDIEETVKKVDVLVLDDLGSEKTSDWVGERLFCIIDARYLSRKQTIVTTNAETMEQLTTLIGDRGDKICSRLYEMTAENKVWLRNCSDYRKRRFRQGNIISAVA